MVTLILTSLLQGLGFFQELARIFYEDSAVAAALRETAGERHLSKRLSAALLEAVLQKQRPGPLKLEVFFKRAP